MVPRRSPAEGLFHLITPLPQSPSGPIFGISDGLLRDVHTIANALAVPDTGF